MALKSIHDLDGLLTAEQRGKLDADYLRRLAREIGLVFDIETSRVRETLLGLIEDPRKNQIVAGLELLEAGI